MKDLIDCAMKRQPCGLVLKNARIFNVFTGETECGEIAVKNGRIAAVGAGYRGRIEYDCKGAFALPGFIESHIHVESSMLSPEEFARLVLPRGTTTVIADPHEIVNVCGIAGAEYLREAFARVPLDVFLQLPSCVPATPFETGCARIDGERTATELAKDTFFGLGEMMNYPAVLAGEEDCLLKLSSANSCGKPIDGHAPALSGEALCAYAACGIATDHESLTAAECREKAARGMYVQLRVGSSANHLRETAQAVDSFNCRRFLLCSDDKNARDLQTRGHLDDALRQLVACGVSSGQAICTATLNAAECYGLKDRGAIVPGRIADIVLAEDLNGFVVRAVFKRGEIVAEDGKTMFSVSQSVPDCVRDTVKIQDVCADRFRIPVKSGKVRAMQVRPHGLVTDEIVLSVPCGDDLHLQGTDLNKLAVIERHRTSGNIGLGLVKGYGLHGAALAITVSHDSHHLVVIGDDNARMARAAMLLKEAGGGMAFVSSEREEVFPLDVAGLMSSAPAEEVIARTETLDALARGAGVKDCYEPFMTLAFLSLAVIPKLKLTDRGLVDVEKFAFVPLEVTEEI
jgi:adenine deaminase